jgi:MFS family permease
VVLTVLIAGAAVSSLAVGVLADRVGRRRCYAVFFVGVAVAGVVVAVGTPWWVLLVLAVTGMLSTDVIDTGPAATLEQVMLTAECAGTAWVYGRYNMAGAAAGALGALAVSLPGVGRAREAPRGWLFAALVPVGLAGIVIAGRLSPAGGGPGAEAASRQRRSARTERIEERLAWAAVVAIGKEPST